MKPARHDKKRDFHTSKCIVGKYIHILNWTYRIFVLDYKRINNDIQYTVWLQ